MGSGSALHLTKRCLKGYNSTGRTAALLFAEYGRQHFSMIKRKKQEQGMKDIERELRKCRRSLSICGISVIALGLWCVAKAVLNSILNQTVLDTMLNKISFNKLPLLKSESETITFTVYLASALVLVFELGLRVYVGLTAISESHGTKRRPVYIVLTVIIDGLILISLLPSVISTIFSRGFLLTKIASLLLDITSFAVLTELAVNAIKLRIYLKRFEAAAVSAPGTDVSGQEV